METTAYMIAGFIAIFAILLGYALSLILRIRRVRRDLCDRNDNASSDFK